MLKSRIPEIAVELDPTIKAAEQAAAELIARSAQARAPVLTGRLRDSIHTEPGDEGGVYVIAGDNQVFYGRFVEHGRVGVPPHPFLIPALEENRARAEELVDAAVRRTVQ